MHSCKKSATAKSQRSPSIDPFEDDHSNSESLSSHLALQQLHDSSDIDVSEEGNCCHSGDADDATDAAEIADGAIGCTTMAVDSSCDVDCGAVGGVKVLEEVSVTCDIESQDVLASCSTTVIQLPLMSVASKSSKKRSKFWGFLKRGRRSTALSKCIETGEEECVFPPAVLESCSKPSSCSMKESHQPGNSIGWPASDARRGSPHPDSPTLGNVRRLSMGAGSRSFNALNGAAQLMTIVPPAPFMQTLTDIATHARVVFRQDLNLRFDESSVNQIGYPHMHYSQSLSNSSSSSSSSGICAPLLPAPDYPPFSLPPPTVHTQVDYMHCLVPDLLELTNCCFYWGVMDRYEAERLLDGRPEGTFLVRDSAQEEFLFSVSFRRYGRSLHARIEQWNHRFSFDSHDPDVFGAASVCSLVEHYKDPAACMFFEPMLTLPLPRVYAFTLQHLCRAVICSRVNYDNVSALHLPRQLQEYLKYYHYKQRICVRRFEAH